MSYLNSFASYASPLFVDPWQQYRAYLDMDLNDLESMLNDSGETEVFLSEDETQAFNSDDETAVFSSKVDSNVTDQEELDNTTTNIPLLCNIDSPKLQVQVYLEKKVSFYLTCLNYVSIPFTCSFETVNEIIIAHTTVFYL